MTRDFGEMVEIRVRDNGTAITPEIKDKLLFQPLFTTKPTGEGTGLGLSISYDIVTHQRGGMIAAESRVGVAIRLPRRRGQATVGVAAAAWVRRDCSARSEAQKLLGRTAINTPERR